MITNSLHCEFYADFFDGGGTREVDAAVAARILRDRPESASLWSSDPTCERGHVVLWDGRQPGGPGTPSVGVHETDGKPIRMSDPIDSGVAERARDIR